MPEREKERQLAGIKQILLACLMLFIQILVFYVSSGSMTDRAWIFFASGLIHYLASTFVQYKLNPELLVQRLVRKREGSKLWDEVLMRASNLMVLIALPVIAGLDVGRFRWSNLEFNLMIIGLILLAISTVLLNWAMITNPHFEPTVRVQKDRSHRVITSGPYRIIRHPGYLAGILYALAAPMIIGSLYAFIPSGIYVLLFLIRTSLEDRTLQNELDGYSEYAKQTKHKLLPKVW